MWQLLNAFSAEQQAIAIYEAEVFWRPGHTNAVFRDILAEERVHRLHMEPYLGMAVGLNAVVLLFTPFNKVIGWVFGSFLSLLPRKLCCRIHIWAENEAAKTYEKTVRNLPTHAPQTLRDALSKAAHQEHEHSRRFAALLKELQ